MHEEWITRVTVTRGPRQSMPFGRNATHLNETHQKDASSGGRADPALFAEEKKGIDGSLLVKKKPPPLGFSQRRSRLTARPGWVRASGGLWRSSYRATRKLGSASLSLGRTIFFFLVPGSCHQAVGKKKK